VTLATVPVLRLGPAARRLGLSELSLTELARELEAEANGALDLGPLVVDAGACRVLAGGDEMRLPRQQMALYVAYARARQRCRRHACREGGRCPACQPSDNDLHDRREDVLGGLGSAARDRLRRRWSGEGEEALEDFRGWLREVRSRLNASLRAGLGSGPRAQQYAVTEMLAAGDVRRRGLAVSPRLVSVQRPTT
jgi:hypothetical protein